MDSEKSKVVRKRICKSVFVRLEVDVFVTFKVWVKRREVIIKLE